MKVAILAGGRGTRLSEETDVRPKPMVEIAGRPILWHIMRYYEHFGHTQFVVALGYKGYFIKEYFANYHTHARSLTVKLASGEMDSHDDGHVEDWTVDLIDTGKWTNTGGRIKRLGEHLGGERFLLTWGDGLSNVDLDRLVAFHESHGRLITVTAVHPPPRFGQLVLDATGRVLEFSEKPLDQSWVNGAFFVCEPGVLDYIDGDDTQFEKEPLEKLAADGELMAYKHDGFWMPMDTIRDRVMLERIWADGTPPWKVWE
jgi:glucose-1-phosphate cytidylyltransferase